MTGSSLNAGAKSRRTNALQKEYVLRYDSSHKAATKQRIIAAAGRRMKSDGIDGSGVATLMSDAGLTNGAFYAHFESKDDLVTNVVADQLRTQREVIDGLAPGRAGIEEFLRWYLSDEHRGNRGDGCPSAALLDEIGRCTDATKAAYTDGVLAIADVVATRLAPQDPASVRMTVLGVMGMLIGTLQLSRSLTDLELADELLEQGIQSALAALF